MKFTNLQIENFKNISALNVNPVNKTIVLAGHNGKGKTSFRQAWYAAITGIFPDNCVQIGKDFCRVSATLEDGNSFSRVFYKDKPNKTIVNGKTSTAKSLAEMMEANFGFNKETAKIVSSAEVVEGLTSGELGEFIMGFIPEELQTPEIISMIPKLPKDMKKIIEDGLPAFPEKFGTKSIRDFYDSLVEHRKFLKRDLSLCENKIKNPLEAPEHGKSISTIEKEIKKIIAEEAIESAAEDAHRKYRMEVQKYDDEMKYRSELKSRIDSIHATRPGNNIVVLEEKLEKARAQASEIKGNIMVFDKNIEMFENTLENLDKTVCPISEKLICTTDKKPFKAELEKLINENKSAKSVAEKNLEAISSDIANLEKQRADLEAQKAEYNKKVALMKEYEELSKNKISMPVEPKRIVKKDFSAEKARLDAELAEAKAYEEFVKDTERAEELKKELKLYNDLCKIFEAKGIVMQQLLDHYVGVFEAACNDKVQHISPDYEIKFVAEDGVSFFVKTSKSGDFKDYASLSSGEKLIAMFGVLDMLNSLSGLKLLMLDDLDKLDTKSFDLLIEVIQSEYVQDAYDNIIICCVDHPDTMDTLKKYSNIDFV